MEHNLHKSLFGKSHTTRSVRPASQRTSLRRVFCFARVFSLLASSSLITEIFRLPSSTFLAHTWISPKPTVTGLLRRVGDEVVVLLLLLPGLHLTCEVVQLLVVELLGDGQDDVLVVVHPVGRHVLHP